MCKESSMLWEEREMKEIVLMPTFMNSFSCIGSACEDSCCIGWQVTIDKKTYKSYKNIKNLKLKGKLEKGVKRIKNDSSSDSKYAYFKMVENKRCPMLEENNLCSIQLNLGESMLSPVCSTYPRMFNKRDREYELSAKLSCPEAARLALLNPEGIYFERKEEEINEQWQLMSRLAGAASEKYLFWDVREFAIDVVQDRKVSLSDRLILLGLFVNKMQEHVSKEQFEAIPSLVKEFRYKMNDLDYMNRLTTIHDNLSLQIQTIIKLITIRKNAGLTNDRYIECLNDMVKGFKLDNQKEYKYEDLEETYLFNYENYFMPFYLKNEYIFENYVVNYMFESMFPHPNGGDIFKQYKKMSIIFSMLKVHFIGISGHYKGLNQDLAIKIIQSFVRSIEHNATYLNSVMEMMDSNGFTSLAHIASLLKDRQHMMKDPVS